MDAKTSDLETIHATFEIQRFIKWAETLPDEPLGSVWSVWDNPIARYFRIQFACYVEFVGCALVTKSMDGTGYHMPPRWARILHDSLKSYALDTGQDRLMPIDLIVATQKVYELDEYMEHLLDVEEGKT